MNTKVMKCPNCGANVDFDDGQDVAYCKYCGTKVIREQPNTQKIRIENPIKIDGKVKLDNSQKYEYQLKQADKYSEEILSKNFLTILDFIDVYNAYLQLENIEDMDNKVFIHRLDFIIKFFTKKPNLFNRQIALTHFNYSKMYSIKEIYETLLNDAVDMEKDEKKKSKLREEYQNKFDELYENVNKTNIENSKKQKEKTKKALKIIGIICIIAIVIFVIYLIVGQIQRAQKEKEDKEAQVFVPNLIGKTVTEAKETLDKLGVNYYFNTDNPGVNGKNYASTEPDAIVQLQQNNDEWMDEGDNGSTIDKRYDKVRLTAMTEDMINNTGEYYIPKNSNSSSNYGGSSYNSGGSSNSSIFESPEFWRGYYFGN